MVQHTINRVKKLNCEKIIAGIYDCAENVALAQVLRSEGVMVRISDDENVDLRFLNCVMEENADYIIRVSGDQCLYDAEIIRHILLEMKKQGSEWFYEKQAAGILSEIVSTDCLIKHKSKILEEGYFRVLEREETVKKFHLLYLYFALCDFRANTDINIRICRRVIEKKLNICDLQKTLATRLLSKDNYLNKTGILGSWLWKSSYEDVFMDEDKRINPWWAESTIDLIRKNLNRNYRVFEWGSGNSTFFGVRIQDA